MLRLHVINPPSQSSALSANLERRNGKEKINYTKKGLSDCSNRQEVERKFGNIKDIR